MSNLTDISDVIIIGSGPAGLSAAIYVVRAGLSVNVIEKEFMGTGQIADSSKVDNYLGIPAISGYDLGPSAPALRQMRAADSRTAAPARCTVLRRAVSAASKVSGTRTFVWSNNRR